MIVNSFMKDRKSREFIIEAIKHWQHKLRQLNENQTKLIATFISMFGEDVVLGSSMDTAVVLTKPLAQKMYNVLNKIVFNSKLKPREIVVTSERSRSIASYNFMFSQARGYPAIIQKHIKTSSGKTVYPPRIFLSTWVTQTKFPFIAAVSAIAHEMIHQYDNENLDALADMIYARELGVEYDPHGEAFTKMMDFINAKHGLAIVKTFSLHGMDKELSRAIASAWKKANSSSMDETDMSIMDAHARIDSNVSMEQIDDNIIAVEVE